MSKIALILGFVSVALLGCGGGGGGAVGNGGGNGGGNGNGSGPMPLTFPAATDEENTFTIADANIVPGSGQTHTRDSVIDGMGGTDTLQLNDGAVVASIAFSSDAPMNGALHLQDIETIEINDGSMVNGNIASGSDALTLNLNGGTVGGDVTGGAAADTFNLNGGTVGAVTGGGGGDTFSLAGDMVTDTDSVMDGIQATLTVGVIDGEVGDDIVQLNAGATVASIAFSSDAPMDGALHLQNIETITIDGGTVNGAIDASMASAGVMFNLMSGTVTGDVTSGAAADTFNLNGGTVGAVTGGGGVDTFNLAGDITGNTPALTVGVIDGGDDDDIVQLNAGATAASIAFDSEDPTGGALHLQNIETITIDGGTVNGAIDASGVPADATEGVMFNLMSGTVSGAVTGSGQADTFNLDGGTITGNVIGGGGGDTFNLAGDITDTTPALTVGVIDGMTGSDIVQLNEGATVASIAFSDTAPTTPGALHLQNIETITIDGSTVNGAIDASGVPADATEGVMFNLMSGTVSGAVTGSGQVDTFNLDGGTVTGDVTGGAEADTFNLDGGMVTGDVTGGAAVDTFNLDGGTVTGNVNGGAGDDSFVIGGSVTVSGMIDGGDGDMDAISLVQNFPLTSANLFDNTGLRITLMDGSILTFTLANIEVTSGITGLTTNDPDALSPTAPDDNDNTITIANDIFGVTRSHTLDSVIDGMGGTDTLVVGTATAADGTTTTGIVAGISFSDVNPTGGNVHLQNVEIITIDGGTVNGAIDASMASAGVMFNMMSGTVSGAVTGSGQADTFNLNGGTITGNVDGGAEADTFNLNGGMIGGNVNGGEGDDSFVIGSGFTLDASSMIDGGGGTEDTLSLASGFAPTSASFADNVLTLTLTDSSTRAFTLANIEDEDIIIAVLPLTFPMATAAADTFTIANNIVGDTQSRERTLDSLIDGGDARDTIRLDPGAVVESISPNPSAPSDPSIGNVHLQSVENIHINGGMVNGDITGSSAGDTIILQTGTVGGNVFGGAGMDVFQIFTTFEFGMDSYIDGGADTDQLLHAGDVSNALEFPGRGGLAADPNIRDNPTTTTNEDGGGSVRNIENHQNAPGRVSSLSVRSIESLALSPALNLYGALSDALMQFGQQTAQGFALADMNPQTGRLTQLMSKDSPFTKGHIWAHKITHSGNGKGSIGLSLTGLTARAPSDYDYEMSLTQHGFDAPVVSSQWGDFGLRAVSHTMTGTIETNIAEAQVSGYGAGLAWLWRGSERSSRERHHKDGLSAHITSLAGAYEVDAHTSPSNPQAVVNEVSEGSFSAINAVISAGIADKRELANGLVMRTTADVSWQTLSLDDFSETGENGIIVNFDKATRFTARVGAGLEAEHWFSDLAFIHETSSGGTLSSGLSQDYRQHDGTAIEMKLGGKVADLAPGLTLKAFMAWRQSVSGLAGEPSARFDLNWKF